ncbi:MAG: RDD family protein, partial [Acidobacteriota bacterium]
RDELMSTMDSRGYVGFEATDRCRHCGYDFAMMTAASALPPAEDAGDDPLTTLFAPSARSERPAMPTPRGSTPSDGWSMAAPIAEAMQDLPLRAAAFPALVNETPPPPARTPLAVRRASADRPRGRSTTQIVRRASASLLDRVAEAAPEASVTETADEAAPSLLRLAAALVDLAVLAGIDLAVVYLTAQLAGLQIAEARSLPLVPLGAFLFGLNVAYLTVFTASGGQTLGKMATGLRVVAVSDGLTVGDALLRVGVALAGGLAAGAGFLPALVRADGRALHDYAARTRVVRVVV